MSAAAQIPNQGQNVVEKAPNGALLFTRPWFMFFQRVSALVNGQSNPPAVVVVGASPFSYEATSSGFVIVEGGTVSLLEYGRGVVFTSLGVTQGPIPISAGDVLRITHTGAPNVTLVAQ